MGKVRLHTCEERRKREEIAAYCKYGIKQPPEEVQGAAFASMDAGIGYALLTYKDNRKV